MRNDFRALCAELTEFVARLTKHYYAPAELLTRARAALAEEPAVPQPQPLADGEVAELMAWLRSTGEGQPCLSDEGYARLTRAAELLQHLSPPQPVQVSERLPEQEDCDAEGMCWYWRPSHPESGYLEGWMLRPSSWGVGHYDFDDSVIHTHWLPAHALPVPGAD